MSILCYNNLVEITLNMKEKLNNNRDLPYYMQLKEILKAQIQSGAIENKKLPPVRQIARDFGVSINTALRAYDELGKEGIVTGSVGRGTFISTSPQQVKKEKQKKLLMKAIEHSLEEALSLDYTIEEFESAVREYVKEKLEMMQKVKLSFVECNIEQLTYFTDHLELDPHIHRFPILLEELRKQDGRIMQEAENNDIFVTSFYHLDEVYKHLGFLGKPIIGINLEPELKTIIEIAKIPPESVVGIVTTSKKFISIIKEILNELNLHFSKILVTNSKRIETVKQLVRKCDAVLVSPKRKKAVISYTDKSTTVIEFVFTPDRTSINNLKVAILELKNNRV